MLGASCHIVGAYSELLSEGVFLAGWVARLLKLRVLFLQCGGFHFFGKPKVIAHDFPPV